jgi:hypothetical protein
MVSFLHGPANYLKPSISLCSRRERDQVSYTHARVHCRNVYIACWNYPVFECQGGWIWLDITEGDTPFYW